MSMREVGRLFIALKTVIDVNHAFYTNCARSTAILLQAVRGGIMKKEKKVYMKKKERNEKDI